MRRLVTHAAVAVMAAALGAAVGAFHAFDVGFRSAQYVRSIEVTEVLRSIERIDGGDLMACRRGLEADLDTLLYLHGTCEDAYTSWITPPMLRAHGSVVVPNDSLKDAVQPAIEHRRRHPSPLTNPELRAVVDSLVAEAVNRE